MPNCQNKALFFLCCFLLADSIYGICREHRENLNIRVLRNLSSSKLLPRKPANLWQPASRYTLAQLSVLLLAGSVMYLGLYNMERQRIKRAKLRTIWFKNNVCLLALVRLIRHTDDVDKMKNLLMSISANFEINAVFGKLILISVKKVTCFVFVRPTPSKWNSFLPTHLRTSSQASKLR